MSRRGIDEDTRAIGVGCVGLDVEMAREHGWTDDDINRTWDTISAAYGATSQQVAKRAGHTRRCPDCECWTVPEGPCHLCDRDRQLAEARATARATNLNEWMCPCGRRFSSHEEYADHVAPCDQGASR
jgi:hypothetical protein